MGEHAFNKLQAKSIIEYKKLGDLIAIMDKLDAAHLEIERLQSIVRKQRIKIRELKPVYQAIQALYKQFKISRGIRKFKRQKR